MTPLEMNAAIAQHLGWKNVHVYEDDAGPPIHCGTPPGPIPYDAVIPRYSEDLNPMAAAVESLDRAAFDVYAHYLRDVTLEQAVDGSCLYRGIIMATAAQRAEAYLRTIGKWRAE